MKHTLGIAVFLGGALLACSLGRPEEGIAADVDELSACPRAIAAADRKRKLVVSHPFGDNPRRYEVLDLDRRGQLTRSDVMFEMDRATSFAPIAFTPDGSIGIAVQERGTLGVFRFDDEGRVTVVDPAFRGPFFARSVVIDEDGARAYVTDGNTEENGGGVYALSIGCDGHLSLRGQVVPGATAHALAFLPGSGRRAVLAAGKAFASAEANDAFLVDLKRHRLLAEGDGFGDHSAIVSSLAVTADGKYALVGDDGLMIGNRVAVVALPSMERKQVLETRAPFAIVTSPFDNAAIVVNGDSADEITTLRYERGNASEPFALTGVLAYTAPRPQLPGAAVMIRRGSLKGRVLVSELLAVRQVQFTRDGVVADIGRTTWESGIPSIVGTIGVQP
jgi:DNA-binding beta-propeller fold protein YncE